MVEKVTYDLMYLCGCALNSILPDEKKCADINYQALYSESQRQSLSTMVYFVIRHLPVFHTQSEKFQYEWESFWMSSIRKAMMMSTELEEICDWFEENRIWYMPLKGSVLQQYYPVFGMREMSDNDILIDQAARQEIHDYMVNERGYKVYEYSPVESYDDVYHKDPIYNFEMHKRLFEEDTPIHEVYYADIVKRLIPDEKRQYARHFSDEDFYIYILSHAFRHFEAGGVGLRLLVDCYVWNHAAQMDRTYLDTELQKLEMLDFERTCHSLSEKVLGGSEFTLNDEEEQMLSYMEKCGTLGNEKIREINRVRKQMKAENVGERMAKYQLIGKRLFPELHYYEIRAPFFYRHRALIPVYWLWRFVRKLIQGGIVEELNALKEVSLEDDD